MRTWLAECYRPGMDRGVVAVAEASVRDAVAGMAGDGVVVRYLGAFLVAADEVMFHVFEAPDAGVVHAIVERSGIAAARVVEAEAVSHTASGELLSALVNRAPAAPTQ